ncbi:MAG: hypothetical protein HFI34_04405 [Lachnospiraceae bacterium]|nr:hypothetical protein [Lachnospiraceae bacterium]
MTEDKIILEEEILEICREAVRQVSAEDREFTMDTELSAKDGIDSLAFMNIIIALEIRFDVVLDERLAALKEAKNIRELIEQLKQIR